MKKIVVPVDFSHSAATALRFASRLAATTGLGLQVVYVFNSLVPSNRRETPAERAAEQRALQAQLEAFTRKHAGAAAAGAPAPESLVAEGIPPNYVHWMSKQEEVVLIVIGGIGVGSAVHKDIFGDIARTVSRDGGCPLVIIPETFEEGGSLLSGTLCSGLPRLVTSD